MSSPTDFGILLLLAYRSFVDELHAELRERGFDDLGPTYGYVFRALDAEPLHLNELARGLGITDPGMLKIVQEMEQRGYVERRPDPEDARAKFVRLATRGRAALAAARRFHQAYERKLGKTHGVAHVATVRQVLEGLASAPGDGVPSRLRAL